MDKFEQLVSQSAFAVAILGDPVRGTFELMEITPRSMELAQRRDFCAVIGVAEGLRARCALAVELDSTTITALTQAFIGLIEAAITHVERSIKVRIGAPETWRDLT